MIINEGEKAPERVYVVREQTRGLNLLSIGKPMGRLHIISPSMNTLGISKSEKISAYRTHG